MMLPIKKTMTWLLMIFLIPTASSFKSLKLHSPVLLRQSARASPTLDMKMSLHSDVSSVLDRTLLLSDTLSDPKGAAVAAAAASVGIPDPKSLFNINVGELFQNVIFGFFAISSLIVGLTFLIGAFIIPAGAKELEKECKILLPDKWNEYVGKLEEGEEMKDRPDLMFELGLLLNKCKADRMQQICVEAKLAPDLWAKYQDKLLNEQELQDRPELIAELNNEISVRVAFVLKENTNICPDETWKRYEEKAGDAALADSPILMEELARELGYTDLLEACIACLLNDADKPKTLEGDARVDATTISGITEIRRKSNQWDEEDE